MTWDIDRAYPLAAELANRLTARVNVPGSGLLHNST
jgi:hypothetical protein